MTTQTHDTADFFATRRAGILLHPSSLPGQYGNGDIGHDAYRFVEFLQSCGLTVWQMLPLGPTHEDGSPYQSLSAHAGNPLLISIDWLIDRGWLLLKNIPAASSAAAFRRNCLYAAYDGFKQTANAEWRSRLDAFCSEQYYWLDDYALFMALKIEHHDQAWMLWPDALKLRNQTALKIATQRLAKDIAHIQFEQFVFFSQWQELRDYARQRGVHMFGDMPIFVAQDSADVWAHRENFMLDASGEPLYVAGVPPDAFSATGQRWGNPLYHWDAMQDDHFKWWQTRFKTQHALFDLIRVDHFRGFDACWQIPATEPTAMHGEWVKVPGRKLLAQIRKKFPALLLVAEDLGVITAEVNALRDDFGLPGMKILQFAFGDDAANPYLPHNHCELCLVYTGTHDNDTTLGWLRAIPETTRQHLLAYLGCGEIDDIKLLEKMRDLTLSSVARLAVLPMQDILQLDTQHRMNKPGTTVDNWRWRFDWPQLTALMRDQLQYKIKLFGRSR